jgi:tripartite ATP-independent transporter DctM subunit
MYEAAFLPSMLLVACYCLYIFYMTKRYPSALPISHENFLNSTHKDVILYFIPLILLSSYSLCLLLKPEFSFSFFLNSFIIQTIISFFITICAIITYCWWLKHHNPSVSPHVIFLFRAIMPPVILIFLVLGTIFLGIATPTEAGAAGAMGAVFISLMRKKISWSISKDAIEKTINLSCFVMFILIGARIFTLTFYNLNGHHVVENLFLNLPGGSIGFLITVNIMIFFLAFFLDFFELVFILVPLLLPIATKLGIDIIWFGVILGINLQTSFMHPPFGFSLFFLRSVAPSKDYIDKVTLQKIPAIDTLDIYKGSIPFLCIQIFVLTMVVIFPELAQISYISYDNLDLILEKLPIIPSLKNPLMFF